MLSRFFETNSQFFRRVKDIARTTVLCLAALVASPAFGQTVLRVDGASGLTVAGGATGADWAHSYLYLQDALDASVSGSYQLWVRSSASGSTITYYADEGATETNNSRSSTFSLKTSVAIYAGFSTSSETALTQRNPYNLAILSGDLFKDDSPSDPFNSGLIDDNAYHVVTSPSGVNNTARLESFKIVSGHADGSTSNGGGGGLYVDTSGPTIVRCVFDHNVAAGTATSQGGGAIHIDSGPVNPAPARIRIASCSFLNNRAASHGGAISQNGGTLDLANAVFRGNEVTGGGTNQGGALFVLVADPNFSTCNISDSTLYINTATSGRSIYIDGSADLNVVNSMSLE
jgi:predicted outer membrane repeat protein